MINLESGEKDSVIVKGLRKVYNGKVVAIENLNFGLTPSTCFGLLGINGAGKSTTMDILSGDKIPTSGTIEVLGLDILKSQLEIRKILGYCPQYDPVMNNLSVREHLEFYASVYVKSTD